MASTSASKSQAPKPRKRIDADLKRGTNGSAFTRCDSCQKDIPIALVDMHDCTDDARAKAKLMEIAKEAPAKKDANQVKPKDTEKRKAGGNDSKEKVKKVKSLKDPNMPKKPTTTFFLFMEDFRKTYKIENPSSKGGTEVAKIGGEKWKAMTEEEKSAYNKKAADLKTEYENAMKVYQTTKQESLKNQAQNNKVDLEEGGDETED